MKPTQEQILSALNELVRENKTELKSEKIELGLVDDIEKLVKSYLQDSQKLDNAITDWYNKIFSVNKEFPNIIKLYKTFDKNLKSLESNLGNLTKQAKELGVNAKDIPAYIEGNGALKRSQDMVDEYLEATRAAKSIKGAL